MIDPEAIMINRRAFANIRLSQLHSVYLRVLSCADRGTSTAVLMSRIAQHHFQKYGNKYLKQFEADAQHTVQPIMPSEV